MVTLSRSGQMKIPRAQGRMPSEMSAYLGKPVKGPYGLLEWTSLASLVTRADAPPSISLHTTRYAAPFPRIRACHPSQRILESPLQSIMPPSI
jgi:hypothetical protein